MYKSITHSNQSYDIRIKGTAKPFNSRINLAPIFLIIYIKVDGCGAPLYIIINFAS